MACRVSTQTLCSDSIFTDWRISDGRNAPSFSPYGARDRRVPLAVLGAALARVRHVHAQQLQARNKAQA